MDLGKDTMPTDVNSYLDVAEKIAVQIIETAKSSNPLDGEFPVIKVENGTTIEKIIIKMAEVYDFDPTALLGWAQKDPDLLVQYFNEWTDKQAQVTYRRDEVRKILTSGKSAEQFAGDLSESLTEGIGYYDFLRTREPFVTPNVFIDYRTINGGRSPANIDGVLTMVRDMYDHITATNHDASKITYDYRTLPKDARIVLTSKLMNIIDVTKLANIFNLTKAELLGKIIKINVDDLDESVWYKLHVIDAKSIIRGDRVYEFTDDKSGRGMFINYFLTSSRLYGVCSLFKGLTLDCRTAVSSLLSTNTPVENKIAVTLTGAVNGKGAGNYFPYTTITVETDLKNASDKTFKEWQVGGVKVSGDAKYTFELGSSATTLTAVYNT